MLFRILGEPAEYAKHSPLTLSRFVESLAYTVRKGYHFVVLEPKLAAWLAEHYASLSARAALLSIAEKYSQRGQAVRDAKILLSIYPTDGSPPHGANPREIRVPLRDCVESKIFENSVLVVENADRDGTLYPEMMAFCRKRLRLMMPISVDPDHGGGENIVSAARRVGKRNGVFLVVMDSDRGHPEAATSKKYDRVDQFLSEDRVRFGRVRLTPGRELENVLPWELLESLQNVRSHPSLTLLRKIYEEYPDGDEHKLWAFLDLKKGLPATVDDAQSLAWITRKIERLSIDSDLLRWTGFGSNICRTIVEDPTYRNRLEQGMMSNHWAYMNLEFIEFLTWFFIGDAPSRV